MPDYHDEMMFTSEAEREFREAERLGLLPEKINRFSDHYLKFLLAAPERKPLLLDLINTILRLMGYEAIEDITPMDRELSPDIYDGKGIRLDYLGHTTSGRTVNLEFQKRGDSDFIKRALYCSGTIIHRQLESGDDYDKICQTIFIALLDFSLFKSDKGWYWDFVLTHAASGKILTNDLLLIFVEMNKLSRTLSALRQKLKAGDLDSDELLTRLALWGGYVTNKGVDIVSEVTTHDSVFSEVVKTEQDYWRDTKNRFIQMMDEKRERDALHEQRRAQRLADEALKKGMEKAMEKGMKKGIKKGMEKGMEKGRIEGEAKGKIEVARNMLSKGFSLGEVADCTGLREEEIRALRETLL